MGDSIRSVPDGGICGGGFSVRKRYRGSFTVEASVIIPIVFMAVVILMYILFYYHDKNIVAGAAYETAVVGVGRQGGDENDLERYFQSRIRGKLILFPYVEHEIQIKKEEITIRCTARKKHLKITVKMSAKRTEPEKFIRNRKKIMAH